VSLIVDLWRDSHIFWLSLNVAGDAASMPPPPPPPPPTTTMPVAVLSGEKLCFFQVCRFVVAGSIEEMKTNLETAKKDHVEAKERLKKAEEELASDKAKLLKAETMCDELQRKWNDGDDSVKAQLQDQLYKVEAEVNRLSGLSRDASLTAHDAADLLRRADDAVKRAEKGLSEIEQCEFCAIGVMSGHSVVL
jgi:hypothetical protein